MENGVPRSVMRGAIITWAASSTRPTRPEPTTRGRASYMYTGGIMRSCGNSVDHCVQAVGIDTANGVWKVRNSWNTDWGEGGYIYVQQGIDACGIAKDATVVTGAKIVTAVEASSA